MKVEKKAILFALVYALLSLAIPTSISGTELSLGLLCLLSPMAWEGTGWEAGAWTNRHTVLFLLLLGVPFLSLVNSPDVSVSLPWIRRHFYMLTIPVVMVTATWVARYAIRILRLFVAASTCAAGYAVLQVFFGETLTRPFLWKGYYVHAAAFFSQPNTLGEVLTIGFLATIFMVWYSRAVWSRLILSGSALLMLGAIVATRTRTPLVVAVAAGSWLTVKLFGRRGLVLVVLALALILVANEANDRLFWRFHKIGRESGRERIEIWRYGMRALASHPVLGIGFGNFREFLEQHVDAAHRHLIRYNHTHNNLLEAAATTGLVGLVLFLLFWGQVGWDMYAAWVHAKDPKKRAVFLTLLTAFLAFHAEGLTECTLKDAEVALPFYVLIGLFYVFRTSRRTSPDPVRVGEMKAAP